MNFTREELRPLAILEGLPDEHIDWFCEHGQRISVDTGEHLFERGQAADAMWIIVKGAIQGFEEIGGQWLLAATTVRGDVTGMLPFSRMTHYPRYTVASEPSEILKLDASLFRELLNVSVEMGRRLVARMSDRVRGDTRLEQQNEKMMSLGRLSAGLAHELNNPATAVRRAAATLAEQRTRLPSLVTALVRHHVSERGLEQLEELRALGRQSELAGPGALEVSAREDELFDWLEENRVERAWELAATFNETGITVRQLADLSREMPEEALGDGLAWLGSGIESDRLVTQIGHAAERIAELVASIKVYSHMDRSAAHTPTDVRSGLDNSVTMLGHKLRTKTIRLTREYQKDLPSIPANAGELNQVWTNLIDNAIDAMHEGGELILRAKLKDQWVEVEIVDDGPGIPDEIRSKIFDPFFTTKEVGVGTGLGLGIARRIVLTHQGDIEVQSRPGRTMMCVRLPVAPTRG
jgi:signal transduction histidine kinase